MRFGSWKITKCSIIGTIDMNIIRHILGYTSGHPWLATTGKSSADGSVLYYLM